jgi:hypothetical protein
MFSAIVAVVGTLLGSVTAYVLQERARGGGGGAARAADQFRDRLAALTALVSALADHRRAMWVREDLRLTGGGPEAYAAARAESHVTRAAVTAPLTTLSILAPDLASVARSAAEAAYALRGAADSDGLNARRAEAIAAVDRLVAAGAVRH